MKKIKALLLEINILFKDDNFMKGVHLVENVVSKVLSIALIGVIFISVIDLIFILVRDIILSSSLSFFEKTLIDIFGLFLNVLIALELLENITAYLRKHIVQVELVVVTALIAVARKIIIYNPEKYTFSELLAFSFSCFALSVSYWLIRRSLGTHGQKKSADRRELNQDKGSDKN